MEQNQFKDVGIKKTIVLNDHPPIIVAGSIRKGRTTDTVLYAGQPMETQGSSHWYETKDNGYEEKYQGILLEDVTMTDESPYPIAHILIHGVVDKRFIPIVKDEQHDKAELKKYGIHKK